MKKALILLLLIPILDSFGQNDSINKTTDYCFVIMDSPAQLFTMRQVNESYLSGYRIFAKGLYSASKNDMIADLIQIGIQGFLLIPLTHEEGHRSILTANNIGSISQPYFNKHGAAYVTGVTDNTLQDFRDNNLPNYIRLHTGGLESDFMLTKRMENIGSFELDDFKNYKWEYIFRKVAILQYYMLGLFKYEIDLEEERNELERDIVGFDTYGAARHLHRPEMDFYRYTRYEDLTNEEVKFVKRLGFRSMLNLLNPLMIGKGNFSVNENTKINFGVGYTMSPFGDFIDETLWIKHNNLNLSVYARQFQNKENWFNGFGLSIVNYNLYKTVFTSLSGHYWNQPKDFDFNTSNSFTGGALDFEVKYFILNKRDKWLNAFSIDVGVIYKTKGFLPEELYLDTHIGLRIGTTIRI